jgi:hypothetical protein
MNNTQQINDLRNRINALTQQIHNIIDTKGHFAAEIHPISVERLSLEIQLDRLPRR